MDSVLDNIHQPNQQGYNDRVTERRLRPAMSIRVLQRYLIVHWTIDLLALSTQVEDGGDPAPW